MDYRFSVIIPVYNAENTLRRCMDSLLRQITDKDELLLVNDGSKDGSLAICKAYQQENSCVRVIDKPNGGVSSARNAGLDSANGTYVIFVDSDDYVSPTLFAEIEALRQEADWDLIRFSHAVDSGSSVEPVVSAASKYSDRSSAFPALIHGICSKALNPPWAKVYKRSILAAHHIRFPLGVSVAEDRAFNIHYSMYVDKYVLTDRVGYYVNIENEQSLSRKRHTDLKEQFQIADAYTDEAIAQADIPQTEKDEYQKAINFGVCRSIYHDAKLLLQDRVGWFARQKSLWKLCGTINRQHMKYPATSYCRKIVLPVRLRLTVGIDLIAKGLLK